MKPCLTTAILIGVSILQQVNIAAAQSIIYTSQNRFQIPFRYDAKEMQRIGAKEVRLFVSRNAGLKWDHAQSIAPSTGKFHYEIKYGDGEYWFAVRTLDVKNQLHPLGQQLTPGLKVVLDTAKPSLALALKQVAPEKIQLQWQASDANLDLSKLTLEYRQPGMKDWQNVIVMPKPSGQTTWTIPQSGLVTVRGSLQDRAGNSQTIEQKIEIQQAKANQPKPIDFSQPIASSQPVLPGNSANAGVTTPITTTQPYAQSTANMTRRSATAAQAPQRVVNQKQFQINYKIDDVGPSGIQGIDLFITQDNGKKWWKYGTDMDRKSPFNVQVPSDGVYGFALRARSGTGWSADPPKPGDAPETLVNVDQTPPVLQLMPIQRVQQQELLIQWKHQDVNPADQPISLYYSSQPQGPWEPISGWQNDRGGFVWKFGMDVPPRVYIRIAARDAAGNISHVITPQPVILDLSKPRARIVDVESVTTPAGTFKR